MAVILCLETATPVCSVALAIEGNVIASREIPEPNMHASMLTSLIEEVMLSGNVTYGDVDALSVSKGPGSYSGLRVGVSTAKGMAYALNKPILGVNTLDSMVNGMRLKANELEGIEYFVPMIDARRMEVYTLVADKEGKVLEETHARILDEESFGIWKSKGKVAFFGTGSEKAIAFLSGPNSEILHGFTCSATYQAGIAEKKFNKKEFEDTAYFEPFYLKDFVGTTPKNSQK